MNRVNFFYIVLAAFAFAAPCAAMAEARKGNCWRLAEELNVPTENKDVQLIREWVEYDVDGETVGEWMDDGSMGVYWYRASLTRGSDYVLWLANNEEELEFEFDGDNAIEFALYGSETASATNSYWYIRAEDWHEDLTNATYDVYFKITDYEAPGSRKCKLNLFEASIANYATAGSKLNPIAIDISSPSSASAVDPGVINAQEIKGECRFRATLQKDVPVTFTATPAEGDTIESLDFELPDSFEGNVEPLYYSDPATDTYALKLTSDTNTTVVLTMAADNLAGATLSWRGNTIGDIGFRSTSQTVQDTIGKAVMTVTRSSNDYAERIRWATVRNTAEPGIDYVPASGEISFEADGDWTADIVVDILPGAQIDGSQRVFAVRLDSVESSALNKDEYSPTPSPNVSYVFIEPTAQGEPAAKLPEAVNEDADTPLAAGTFMGVLSGEITATVSVTSGQDGSLHAAVDTGDGSREFSGQAGEVSSESTIGGITWTSLASIRLPDGTVADLADAPGGAARLSGSIYVEEDGTAVEKFFSCALYRVESQLDSYTLGRMRDKAGRYTVALSGEIGDSQQVVGGYLTVEIGGNSAVTISGALPGFTIEAFTATAFDTDAGLAIPFVCRQNGEVLSGTLLTGDCGCELAWQHEGETVTLSVHAEKYDYWTLLDRLYAKWSLCADAETGALGGLQLIASDGGLSMFGDNVTVGLIRESGVLAIGYKDASFKGVLLNENMENGTDGAFGMIDDGSPVALRLAAYEPEQEVEEASATVIVTFDTDGGGASGLDAMECETGTTLFLPSVVPVRVGYSFAGWLHDEMRQIYASAEEISAPPSDTTLTALWSDASIGSALDSELPFFLTPETSWGSAVDASAVGGSLLRAENIGPGKSVDVFAFVEGSGLVSFRWGVVRRSSKTLAQESNVGKDALTFYVDGEAVAVISNQTSLAVCDVEVSGQGLHKISWRYTTEDKTITLMSENGSASVDCVDWQPDSLNMAEIVFDPGEGGSVYPASRRVEIGGPVGALPVPECAGKGFVRWVNSTTGKAVDATTLMPYGGLTLKAVWGVAVSFDAGGAIGSVPAISAETGDPVELPTADGLSKENFDFVGWSDGSGIHAPGYLYYAVTNTTLTALWADATYRLALKTDLAVETTSCVIDTSEGTDGKCVKSSVSSKGAKATISTAVGGAGTVAFRWKLVMSTAIPSAATNDRIDFYVDDGSEPVLSLSAATDWTDAEYEILDAGSHTLRWVYTATTNGTYIAAGKYGSGYLDMVEWTPAGRAITVTFDPNGGSCDELSRQVVTNGVLKTLPVPEKPGFGFVGWYLGEEQVMTGDRIGEEDLTLVARWGLLPVSVTFDAGGASGDVPESQNVVPSTSFQLPAADGLTKTDCVFAGWSDGSGLYMASEDYQVTVDVVFTATWRNAKYEAALDCTYLAFSSENDAIWTSHEDSSAVGGTSLAVASPTKGLVAELSAVAETGGVVSFSWFLAQAKDIYGKTGNDSIEFLVDDEVKCSLAATVSAYVKTEEVKVSAGQKLMWRYNAFTSAVNEKALKTKPVARLDNVVWTPAVPVDFSDAVVTDSTTPGDLGITNGAFSAETAGSDGLKKLVAWAKENGITVAEVNGMEFSESGEATDGLTEAYLLDCAVADIQDAKELFRINSFSAGADGSFSIDPADGDAFGNGTVELRYADTPKGPFSAERPAESGKLFIRLYLVR